MFKNLFQDSFDFKVAAVKRKDEKIEYSKDVLTRITKENREEYFKCARKLNSLKEISLVNIQHEFGIFGGDRGEYLIDFLNTLKKPAVITFHSILPNPDDKFLETVRRINKKVKKIIVMTDNSKKILAEDYKIPAKKIFVIPHGIHSFPYENNISSKKFLKLENYKVLLTFGLLSPSKGIEYALDALPEIVKKYPNVLYLIVGQTHPVIKKLEGEKYRNYLLKKTKELNIEKNVRFINKFLKTRDLITYLKAQDIYISTSPDPNQAVSGTFSYALGSGRPVISTSFPQAKEALTQETGILVEARNPKEFETAILELLDNKERREHLGMNAYFRTRKMTWQNVSVSYMKTFALSTKNIKNVKALLPISVSHILKMTDDFGMIQFAKLSNPDKNSGYTVDDNARALLTLGLYYEKTKDKEILKYLKKYLEFLDYALDTSGYFRNYIDKDKKFIEEKNSIESDENPTTRALYALARFSSIKCIPENLRKKALNIFSKSTREDIVFTYSRSISFYIKALHYILKINNDNKYLSQLKLYTDTLIKRFEKNGSPDWFWPENYLSYSNGLIPEAIILAYKTTGDKKYLEIGIQKAEFLIKHSFSKNLFIPIGQNGWFYKGKTKISFDQQPEETAGIVELTKTLYEVTGKKKYLKYMYKTFNWFLGDNVLNQVVYDCATSGCYDGIGEKEINLNQGAESIVSYLMARFSVETPEY